MKSMEPIKTTHTLKLGISPKEADIAIVSIDYAGTPGRLNSLVLKEYGYSIDDLPLQDKLQNIGFAAITDDKKKSVLFVVTVDGSNTGENLEKNLYKALVEFRGWIRGKKTWIPLMGTGDGGLSLSQSYDVTAKVINRFQENYPTETTFLISIPNNPKGQKFFREFEVTRIDEKHDPKVFVKAFKGKFYLVSAMWYRNDQLSRFVQKGIWQKGPEDTNFSTLIDQINKNDILIVKSTYTAQSISYLRIKAIGIVIKNLHDGTTIAIDWKIKDVSIDIENLGYYKDTIQEPSLEDVTIILSSIDKNRFKELIPVASINPDKETIAGLISDSDNGIDYLDITKDVNAFARVITAKSFEPPLAIALFGKWGSGKSFFMKKLKKQITILSSSKPDGIFCNGVAHIHFNAWSYMDSNLWASIVTKIFEELNEYISKNGKTEETKKEIGRHLTNQLTISKEDIGILETKKNAVVEQISSLEQKRKVISDKLDEKIHKVRTDTLWKIVEDADREFNAKEKILIALKENDTYLKSENDLKRIIPEEYWSSPEKTYELAKSRYTFLKEFFRKDKILKNVIWIVAILLIILFTPILLELFSIQISKSNFLIPEAVLSLLITGGALWRRAETVFHNLQPIIASFWNIKESYEKQIKEAVSKFEQEDKALKLQIEKGKSEVLLIADQIQKAETIKADLEFRINNAFATEALYSFIDKRSKSEDYKKHLGIISIIRRDFEILNDLFIYHNQEAEKIKNAEEFKNKFKTPLERIILYIDDLDRCPEENVVQVLEAVNLLMAYPLFIVIVGVDSRWVKNALIKKYALQFAGNLHDNQIGDSNIEIIEPSNYLEKIFQVPFHLKDAKDISVKDMIRQLAESKAVIIENVEKSGIKKANVLNDSDSAIQKTDIEKPSSTHASLHKFETILLAKPEALILTEKEVGLMQDMSEVIGNNPRAIKRFVNIYRIIKAHEEFSYQSDNSNQELSAILFLLALSIGGYRKLLPSFEEFIQDENNRGKYLTIYFKEMSNLGRAYDLSHHLNLILSTKSIFTVLQNTKSEVFKYHNDFIRRFTFKQL